MTTSPKIYPSSIARAISCVDELPLLKEMPDGFLRVLVRIIKKIDIRKPHKPIWASRTTLAQESGKSVETVQRALRWLEEKGLIERDQQARAGLRGSSSAVVVTAALIDALMLSPHTQPTRDTKTGSDASKGGFQRVDGCTLPTDLVWLTKSGLSARCVLKLMSIAKMCNKRLSDITQACRQYLEPLHGRALLSYLLKLARKNQDFAAVNNHKAEQEAMERQQERLNDKATALLGRYFTNADRDILWHVEAAGLLRGHKRDGSTFIQQMSPSFLEAIEEGRLAGITREGFGL